MRRSYLKCPYCSKDIALQGINMHVKVQHPDKHAEFVKNYETLKKTAVVKEIDTTKPAKSPAPVTPEKPAAATPAAAAPVTQKSVHKSVPKPREKSHADPVPPVTPGGEAPPPGPGAEKSFLDELEEVSDGILKWINTP